ncbi:hypothetical protein [Pseudonocardia kongjuensis]
MHDVNMGWADEPDDTADRGHDTYWHDERDVPRLAGCLVALAAAAGRVVRHTGASCRRAGRRVLALLRGRPPGPCAAATGTCLLDGPGNLIVHPPHGPLVARRRRRRRDAGRDRCHGGTGSRCRTAPRRTGPSSG